MAIRLPSPRVLAWALAGAALACGAAQPTVRSVAPEEVSSVVESAEAALLLDVRSESEYRSGHVPGALHVPHDQIRARLAELEAYRERPVIAYCESGRRAGLALEALAGAGFEQLGYLEGNMARWRQEGRPIETAPR